ncbi:hypothetical protein F3Y22_tig00116962pilonHSYRG00688 [Hibiscus syriacus]|uniref:Uncharacterized protein n=1 Tax=Hibiscus syriacus TaxID=106335 RepID=A0A6A2WKZ5_HIBSY|nr:hypothetical protein F3Y22_tig00116962pilonHSYRG00688 [Hibiscus syriacus]
MAVSTIALYASTPSSVCSTPHQININSCDFDLNSRSSSSTSSTAASSSCPRPMVGGLSCLFSSPSVKSNFSSGGEDLGSYRGEELKELSCSFCYSTSKFGGSLKPIRAPYRRALGSCIDYDSQSFEAQSGGCVDELPFSMEDNFMEEVNLDPCVKELLLGAQMRHKIFSEDFVVKAFYEAEKAHRGQMRASGDPYLQHCVETAVLTFDAGVADLVLGVSKLSQLNARAVLIKLADRLHNMMTLDALPLVKQKRLLRDLGNICTLANRLGISSWKEQLENLCFKHLNPDQHKKLSSGLWSRLMRR